ncbi:DNA topoisomerase 1 [Vibrio stylophorae]|uniref:DNA topoisomerase 1 n=1 Tax=Vibrio stylophorae TaxID=659351 RepID=A0ABM8ZPN7_9VIBR|nr:type I DNA topoisomerase [Vibrio stylophorae]CAH0532279.1 DNA topoisomerase 1 [Vibrio stylophorae]
MSDDSLFSHHEHALEQRCPQCGGALQFRQSKHGPFLGCEHYPQCDYIQPLHGQDGQIIKELDVPCPACAHPLVLRRGRYGMFIGCSQFPECQHIEPIDKPDETHLACPECGRGELLQRKSRHGKAFYACNQYPKCRFAVNQKPVAGRCQQCGFGLLVEKKTAAGIKLVCAERRCGALQTDAS